MGAFVCEYCTFIDVRRMYLTICTSLRSAENGHSRDNAVVFFGHLCYYICKNSCPITNAKVITAIIEYRKPAQSSLKNSRKGSLLMKRKDNDQQLNRKIKTVVDMVFDDIPYSEEVAEAQSKIETALNNELDKIKAGRHEDEAIEELLRDYGRLASNNPLPLLSF